MSDGNKPKGRARGKPMGRARGFPAAPRTLQQSSSVSQQPSQQQQQPSQQQQPGPWRQQPQPGPSQQPQPGPSQQPQPSRPMAWGAVPAQKKEDEVTYGVEPSLKELSGAFRGLTVGQGEARPGRALRRGALRGRNEIEEPIRTRKETLTDKKGVDGQPLKVVTNHFRLIKKTDWSLYQYRVDFSPDEERTKIRKALMKVHKNEVGEAYLFDGSMLFTIQRLKADKLELFSKRDSDQATIRITIKFTNELALGDYQYIQLYNIILRFCMDAMQLQLVGREYFNPNNSHKMPRYKLEIWPGYSTSILQYENDIMLNIDVSHKVLRRDTVLDVIEFYKNQSDGDYKHLLLQEMLGAVVFTHYNNKPYRVDDIAFDLTPRDTFKIGDKDVSYIQYYLEKYQVAIKNMNQPLLVSKPKARDLRGGRAQNIILVPELCHMTGISEAMRKNKSLMMAVAEKTRIPPSDRVESYYTFMKNMSLRKDAQTKLNMWNIEFASRLQTVDARLFGSETLFFQNGLQVKAHDGDWTRSLRNSKMLNVAHLEKWAVIAPRWAFRHDAQKKCQLIEAFINELKKVSIGLGIQCPNPEVLSIENDKIHNYMGAIDAVLNNKSMQIIMFIVNPLKAEVYCAIKKKCIVDRPIPSQVISDKTLNHKNITSIATKIMIQINCKLGGSPWFTSIPFKGAGKDVSMIVGFDVCHDTRSKGTSVGAIVASLDYYFSRYYSAISRHSLGEELSNDIAVHFCNAIDRFRAINEFLPPRIILYRDGVGESNIRYVLEHEIKKIKDMMDDQFPGNSITLTVILVSKRIQTRIFVPDRNNTYQNPRPGTVVDDTITQPEKYDFFLVSQSVRQGTVTPTNYNVISDTSSMTPNQIQRITYKMCHLYYNCSSTVRVPAQVQYAHKLAFLIGQVVHVNPSTEMSHLLYFL